MFDINDWLPSSCQLRPSLFSNIDFNVFVRNHKTGRWTRSDTGVLYGQDAAYEEAAKSGALSATDTTAGVS